MKKIDILMNKPVHCGLSKLQLSKTLMYEIWYDYVKPKYGEKAKWWYMDTDSLIAYIKTDDIYEDIAKDVETRFDASNYEYKNNKIRISAPTWNEEFELPDVSYSVSDIQDYFKYILKKHEAVTDNPLIMIYVNKIENRITFKIKTGYYLELLMPKTKNLLGSTKSKINKDKMVKMCLI